ncbi:MAG TPA: hypothetical protein VN088_04325 [Nocardioides sp.]|nr:hypothetical protein [Nocardioides sp.]
MDTQTTSGHSTAPRRRHLMDPNAPRVKRDPEAVKRLETVQRRVVSVLAMTTIAHLTAGMILAAVLDADHASVGVQIGLVVIGVLFWNVGVAAVLGINRRPIVSWWHLTALLPLAVGLWLVLR